MISRGTAILLLFVYASYLFFQVIRLPLTSQEALPADYVALVISLVITAANPCRPLQS